MVQVLSKKPKKKETGLVIPEPFRNELPTIYAERIGNWYSSFSASQHRKQQGQFFTPISVARFMASLVSGKSENPSILDPGAGCGILSCAICEALLLVKTKPQTIHLDLFETDEKIYPLLEKVASHLADYLHIRGINLSCKIIREDYVLQHADVLQSEPQLFSLADSKGKYDICISNPPYFKLAKSDPRSMAASTIVHGQPNIYFLFMAIAASMLKSNGEFIFITPRSFASGSYFQKFRRYFFDLIRPQAIHIFESRKEAFKKDKILQENIILKGIHSDQWHKKNGNKSNSVSISVSHGYEDLDRSTSRAFLLEKLLDMKTRSSMLRIPQCREEEDVLDRISSWKGSFDQYGLKISTGPVVAFRAKSHLAAEKNGKLYAPLLWLHHVKPLQVEWPIIKLRKPQYIEISDASEKLLIRDQNCVLVRRFSAKEENRRLVAAPLCKNDIRSDYIGLENHLNYIYKKDGSLTKEEVWGLAAILNCQIIDTYYRIFNGSTQVGASEIGEIPLPPWETIRKIGAKACSMPKDKIDVELLTKALLKS
jgi:adenine-specific DNA-methyltransferase